MEEEVQENEPFSDGFAEEFEQEEQKPSKKLMPQKKPEKLEYEEDSEEEMEDEEEPKIETRGRPKGTFKKPQIQGQKEVIEERYSPYHILERTGVKDNKTNLPIGEDIYTILASIKNDLHELKVGLLG